MADQWPSIFVYASVNPLSSANFKSVSHDTRGRVFYSGRRKITTIDLFLACVIMLSYLGFIFSAGRKIEGQVLMVFVFPDVGEPILANGNTIFLRQGRLFDGFDAFKETIHGICFLHAM